MIGQIAETHLNIAMEKPAAAPQRMGFNQPICAGIARHLVDNNFQPLHGEGCGVGILLIHIRIHQEQRIPGARILAALHGLFHVNDMAFEIIGLLGGLGGNRPAHTHIGIIEGRRRIRRSRLRISSIVGGKLRDIRFARPFSGRCGGRRRLSGTATAPRYQ